MDEQLNNYLDFSPFYAGFDVEKDYVRANFLDNYSKLPQILKDFMVSENTATQIYNLGTSQGLNQTQIIVMSAILRYVIVGDIYVKTMPQLLMSSINISNQEANTIFDSLVNQVLQPVWEDIKKIQIQKFGAGVSQPAATPAQPITQTPPSLHEQNMAAPPQTNAQTPTKYPGQDLPETGGNIINLRNQN